MSIERLEREKRIDAKWRCFPLHPEVPEEGMMLHELFNRPPQEIQGWACGMRRKASELGLAFGPWTKIFNTRMAQEVGLWAESRGKGHEFRMALFKSTLVDEANIASGDVLLRIVDSIGLNSADAEDIMANRHYRDAVDEDWEKSRARGITAVPTLVLGDRQFVGAQPYEEIVRFVRELKK